MSYAASKQGVLCQCPGARECVREVKVPGGDIDSMWSYLAQALGSTATLISLTAGIAMLIQRSTMLGVCRDRTVVYVGAVGLFVCLGTEGAPS